MRVQEDGDLEVSIRETITVEIEATGTSVLAELVSRPELALWLATLVLLALTLSLIPAS